MPPKQPPNPPNLPKQQPNPQNTETDANANKNFPKIRKTFIEIE